MIAVHRVTSVAAATATHSVLALALSVLLARLLGPAGRGTYALLTLTAMMGAALGTFGFESGNAFTLSRQPERTRAILASSLLLAGVSGTAGAGLVLWSTTGSRSWLLQTTQELVWVASLAMPFLILAMLLNGALVGLGRVSTSAWLGTGAAALSLLLVSLASLAPVQRLSAVVWAFTLCAVVQACVPFVLLMRAVGGPLVDPRPAFAEGLGYSLTSYASNVLHMLHLRADVFLVSLFLGPRDVGLYALSQAVCEWVWLLPRSAATVLFPFVAGSDDSRALAATTRTCRVVLSLAGLAALCLGVAVPWLIPGLFGRAFSGSVLPICLLLPGIWVGSIAGSLSAFLLGRGRPDLPLLTSLVCLALNVPLNLALIPRHGIAGAAVASAVTYSLMTVVNTLLCRRVAAVRIADLFLLEKGDSRAIWQEIRRRWGALPGGRVRSSV
jgi:O-antigen/teichoic acid export membrane protein